ncbi:TPA: class I SAM-dependent methyltransferase [Candidatus Ventrenecus stercoripullorum]|nr:class I SAM-dependent methyltransferase [Candidatus Ventrenecus stercoripullorum]
MRCVNDFKEYQILDMANGEKLESWDNIILQRPDPQIIWPTKTYPNLWKDVDAIYRRSNTGGGSWHIIKNVPPVFEVKYHDLTFCLKLMGFKHTGLFPEQAVNWNLLEKTIKESNRPLKVLNLFAYTGAASVVALSAGASVTHVDSSKGMVDWAKENVNINHLQDKPIRFLVDDCLKFVKREIRRGNKYDIILMDPPSFGRGSKNEVWTIEKNLYELVDVCTELMNNDFKLFLINSYSTGLSKTVLENLLQMTVNKRQKGHISSDEIGLPMKNSPYILPCGCTAIWQK